MLKDVLAPQPRPTRAHSPRQSWTINPRWKILIDLETATEDALRIERDRIWNLGVSGGVGLSMTCDLACDIVDEVLKRRFDVDVVEKARARIAARRRGLTCG